MEVKLTVGSFNEAGAIEPRKPRRFVAKGKLRFGLQ